MAARLKRLPGINLTVAAVERPDDRPVQEPPGERKRKQRRQKRPAQVRRWGIFDLLFVEVDRFEGLDEDQRDRLKNELRGFFRKEPAKSASPQPTPRPALEKTAEARRPSPQEPQPTPPTDPHPRSRPETGTASGQLEGDAAVAALALPVDSRRTLESLMASLQLARQFRDCLALDTPTARRAARYLKTLLILHTERFQPRLRVDV